MRPIWLVGAVVLGAAALTLLAIAERGPYESNRPGATVGGLPVSTTGNAVDALHSTAGREDFTARIGERVELVVDNIGTAANDVAFWTGSPPDELLVVIGRDTRTARARQRGTPSDDALSVPVRGKAIVRGVIEPLPHAEAMASWGLSRRDVAVAQERGVYVRVDTVVPLTPDDARARE